MTSRTSATVRIFQSSALSTVSLEGWTPQTPSASFSDKMKHDKADEVKEINFKPHLEYSDNF